MPFENVLSQQYPMKMYDSSNASQKCMKIAMLPEHKTHVAPNSMKQLSHQIAKLRGPAVWSIIIKVRFYFQSQTVFMKVKTVRNLVPA